MFSIAPKPPIDCSSNLSRSLFRCKPSTVCAWDWPTTVFFFFWRVCKQCLFLSGDVFSFFNEVCHGLS